LQASIFHCDDMPQPFQSYDFNLCHDIWSVGLHINNLQAEYAFGNSVR
jgi:hypothetical protein